VIATLTDYTNVLSHWETERPDAPALTGAGTTRTWAQLARRVRRVAAALRDAGVRPGDRIAVLDLNHPSCLELTLACAQIGAANVVVNFRLAPPEIAYVINDAGPDAVHRTGVRGRRRQAARARADRRAHRPHRRGRRWRRRCRCVVGPTEPDDLPRGAGRVRFGRGGHRGHELVAAPVHGTEEPLLVAAVADGAARRPQRGRERGLVDEPVAPDGVEQLVLRHHPIAVLHEVAQQVESAGLDVHRRPGTAGLVAGDVELVLPEPIGIPRHGRSQPVDPEIQPASSRS
jgi:hypothetical protein